MCVSYCGPVCQRADWDVGHKAQCKVLAAERLAAEAALEAAKSEGARSGGRGGGGGGDSGNVGGATPIPFDETPPPPISLIPTGMDSRVTCWDCASCGKALEPKTARACTGCRKIVYCDLLCRNKHMREHRDTCYFAVSERVWAGDVHKDDAFREVVIKAYICRARGDFGDKDESTLKGISTFGRFYQLLGRLSEAEPLYREALETRRTTLGPKHPSTLASMNNLALLLQDQGKLGEAEPLMRDALEIQRATLGPKHPDTLTSMNNLALH